jgi:hypothetical protein
MPLDRDWERFRGGPTPNGGERVHVTLNPESVLYLNANAHRILGSPEAVHFYFNRKKDSIALSPAASPRLNDAFPVRKGPHHGSVLIYANPFCRNFGISVSSVQKFVAPDIDGEGNMLLDLTNMVTVKRPPRQKKP